MINTLNPYTLCSGFGVFFIILWRFGFLKQLWEETG